MSYERFIEGGEVDPSLKVEVRCLGKILEGKGAISSSLHESEYEEFGLAIKESIGKIEDYTPACVDGRRCISQADGSEPKIRPRVAGGSLAPFAMAALGSDEFAASFTHQAKSTNDVAQKTFSLAKQLGHGPGAHIDCGAANGLVAHIESLSTSPRPNSGVVDRLVATENLGFNSKMAHNRVTARAKSLAKKLSSIGYSGEEFIMSAAAVNPGGVEKLEVDMNAPNHGHAESAWVLVDGLVDDAGRPLHTLDEEQLHRLTGHRVFCLNLNSLRRAAQKLSANPHNQNELFYAALDWHLNGVAPNLADNTLPVFVAVTS